MSGIILPDDPNRLPWSMTLGELVDRAVARDPYKVYLHYGPYQVTYQELLDYTLRVAGLFRDLGVRHGDRVCVFLPNGREVPLIWLGLSRIGAITVPINTAYRAEETAYILNNADAKVLVSHHTLMDVAREAAGRCPSLDRLLVVSEGEGGSDGWVDFWDLLRTATSLDPGSVEGQVTPEDVSMLVYTSGTTGNPKGVMITHEMYVAAGQGFATWTGSSSDDRFFTCLPYYHANSQYYSTMGSMVAGASLVLTDRFSASRFWDQVRESGATVVNFIGMMMPVLLKQPPGDGDRDNSVRLFYGSPALSEELLSGFEERFGAAVQIGFGMTETCYGTIERLGEGHRSGSSGKSRWHPDPRFHNELRIRDDSGEVSPGTVGEITIRNPAIMPGYWRDPGRTAETLRDGWLCTGDLGWLDDEGHLYFVDRKKDVVRRRGENISSQEVENVIKRHPGVLDCAVIAVPSELGEDEVKAYVVPRDPMTPLNPPLARGDTRGSSQGARTEGDDATSPLTPEDVVYWCAEHLAYFKVPRYVEMRDDFPRTPSFRVRKDVLRRERDDLTSGCFDREKAGIRLR